MNIDLRGANANRQLRQPKKPPVFGIELSVQEFADLCLVAANLNVSHKVALTSLIEDAKAGLSKPNTLHWLQP